MRISSRTEDGVVVVSVEGRLHREWATKFMVRAEAIIGDQWGGRILLDCTQMTYISTAGLRDVLLIAKKIAKHEGRFAICTLAEGTDTRPKFATPISRAKPTTSTNSFLKSDKCRRRNSHSVRWLGKSRTRKATSCLRGDRVRPDHEYPQITRGGDGGARSGALARVSHGSWWRAPRRRRSQGCPRARFRERFGSVAGDR